LATSRKSRKVVSIKKGRFQPNLTSFIILLIIIYVLFLGWSYITKERISIYEVNTTDISDDTPLYGFILRSEEVEKTEQNGYINYYNAEGTRVGKGDVVYTVDTNGEVSNMLKEIQKSTITPESILTMREVISSFQNSFSMADYTQVSSFQYAVNNVIFEQSRGTLFSDLNKSLKASGQSKDFLKVTAPKSGVISYSVDGYEELGQNDITSEILEQYGIPTKKQLQSSESVPAGSPVYKIITSNDWSLIVKLTDEYYDKLKDLDTVRVTIVRDDISFNASVELYDRDGVHFAKLSTARYMERYINDRFLKIEFNLKSASGLKIPNSSILKKEYSVLPPNVIETGDEGAGVLKQVLDENGNPKPEYVGLGDSEIVDGQYYVDTSIIDAGDVLKDYENGGNYTVSSKATIEGVYCVNEGFCEFRPIEIIYQNKEYTIVSDATIGGLATYDHIVVDPSSLSDNDFIE